MLTELVVPVTWSTSRVCELAHEAPLVIGGQFQTPGSQLVMEVDEPDHQGKIDNASRGPTLALSIEALPSSPCSR